MTMKAVIPGEPLKAIMLAGKGYAVMELGPEGLAAMSGAVRMAAGEGSPTNDESRRAAALLTLALIVGGAPHLSVTFILAHLTPEENAKVALEYRRQLMTVRPAAGSA